MRKPNGVPVQLQERRLRAMGEFETPRRGASTCPHKADVAGSVLAEVLSCRDLGKVTLSLQEGVVVWV